jgi:peptidoglycan hydrolase CwlO-like protein
MLKGKMPILKIGRNTKMNQNHHNTKRTFRLTPLITASVLTVGMVLMPLSGVHADQYDDQISALKAQISQNQQNVNKLEGQAGNLQSQIDHYANQIAALQAQISANQAQIKSLNKQIKKANEELVAQKDILAAVLRNISSSQSQTPLEALVTSKNFGDFFDQQDNKARLTEQVNNTIGKINALQKKLSDQKDVVTLLLKEQTQNKQQLALAQAQVNAKLAQNHSQQAAFSKQVANASAQISQLRAAQAQMYANISSGGSYAPSGGYGQLQWRNLSGGVFCGGGYPSPLCNSAQDSLVDSWQLYNRECVSYAAWRMSLNHHVSSFNGAGMAYQFGSTAAANGDAYVDGTPAPGTVVVIPPAMIGGVGHVAVVESVSGGWIHVSQYNWQPGVYSTMDLKVVSGLQFVHFTH